MKKILLTLALVAFSSSAFAQATLHGTITLHNRNLIDNDVSHHAPIRLSPEAQAASGAPTPYANNLFSTGLFWKDTSGNYILANTAGNGQVASTTPGIQNVYRTAAGSEGTFQTGIEVEIANHAANTPVTFQIRAWLTSQGTYDQATIRGSTVDYTINALGGTPAGVGATPISAPFLDGLGFFGLTVVPEPSTYALGIAGLGALAFLRRRK